MTDLKPVRLERDNLRHLLETLKSKGYTLAGPTVRDGSIIYDEIDGMEDLPEGWGDEQDAGSYKIVRREDNALFGFNSSPHSWKNFLYPPKVKLWSSKKTEEGFVIEEDTEETPHYALIGVHSCDLHAIEIHDRVFMQPDTADPRYGKLRDRAFIVALNCAQCSKTCFCDSMGTGPKAESGFDLAMTEIVRGDEHFFVVEAGSDKGGEVLEELNAAPAGEYEINAASEATENARSAQVRSVNTDGIKEMFERNLDNPHWENVADRCMSCANCTMVCPTCFCSKTEDEISLGGDQADRWRFWESCFSLDFSYIHGGSIRKSIGSRYRQWITHKFSAWFDQYGTSGCVGCGRCVTWCPVGIDITEEAQKLRESEGGK